jgi:hypothetical protein
MMLEDSAIGALMVYESFDYTQGSRPGNGGLGWKQAWGSDPLATTSTGLDYADVNGNSLQVSGNASTRQSNGSTQVEAIRDFQAELIDTFWFSVLIKGANGNETVSLGINESFYIGQGAKDVTSSAFGVYDADKTQLSGVAILAVNEISLFVGRALYNQSHDKFTHLNVWRNPVLDTEPNVADSTSFYSGTIKEFDKIPKIAVYHTSNLGALDEVRFGQTFADVTAFTSAGRAAGVVPEPSAFVILVSLIPFGILMRRRQLRRQWVATPIIF